MSDSLRLHELQPARFLCPWDSSGKNTGVSCHALLQGVFLTHRSNPHLLHLLQTDSLALSHQENSLQWLIYSKYSRIYGIRLILPYDNCINILLETSRSAPFSFRVWNWHKISIVKQCGSNGEASACNEGNLGLIPGLGRSPGEGNGNLLQHSFLENPMDWGAW